MTTTTNEFKREKTLAIETLKSMISTPSISRDEGNCADMISEILQREGYQVNREKNNLWVVADNKIEETHPTLLLNSHIDTVKAVAGWSYSPFIPTQEGDKLIGLGSNDAGASVVSLMATFLIMAKRNRDYNLILGLSAEEEVSGKDGIERFLKVLPNIDFAIVGEPTRMDVAIAERGLVVLDCVAKGVAGHAARNEGVNALYKALPDIEWFRQYKFPLQSTILEDVKMSVTQIEAGTQHNVVPDICRFVVDVRTNECYTNEELVKEIQKRVACEVTPRSLRLNSSSTPQDHPILQRAKLLNCKTYGSPTLSDQALMSFPTMKMGPGDSARSHTPDEYIYISEIEKGIERYVGLLEDVQLKG